MIRVSVTQHLIHTEEKFVKELTKADFTLPNQYSFSKIYDDSDVEDGSILIFEINEKDVDLLIEAVKKVSVDYIHINKLDEFGDPDEELYSTY